MSLERDHRMSLGKELLSISLKLITEFSDFVSELKSNNYK